MSTLRALFRGGPLNARLVEILDLEDPHPPLLFYVFPESAGAGGIWESVDDMPAAAQEVTTVYRLDGVNSDDVALYTIGDTLGPEDAAMLRNTRGTS